MSPVIVNLMGTSGFNGQEEYVCELVPRLSIINPDRIFWVVCPSDIDNLVLGSLKKGGNNLRLFFAPSFLKGYFLRFLFIQLFFPVFSFVKRSNTVISPTPLFPILCCRKNLITIHDCAYDRFPEETSFSRRKIIKILYFLAKYFSRFIVTVSEFSKRELGTLHNIKNDKIKVVYNILPSCKFDDSIEESEKYGGKYFVAVGLGRYRKNLRRLLQAFALFSQKFSDYQLVILGRLDKRFWDIDKELKDNNIRNKVIIEGFVSIDNKYKILSKANALVIPSIYEGFGIPILEAQKLSVPVLAANVSAIPEVAGRGAYYFDPFSVDSIYNCMIKFVGSSNVAEKIKEGHVNIERFDGDKIANEYSLLLK